MSEQKQAKAPEFNDNDRKDLCWMYDEANGELGLSSSFQPLVDMAQSGPRQGGTVAQHTKAQMGGGDGTPCARWSRVALILANAGPWHTAVLRAYYGSAYDEARIAKLSPADAQARKRNAPSSIRLHGPLGPVVDAMLLGGALLERSDDVWDMVNATAEDPEGAAGVRALVKSGKAVKARHAKAAEDALAAAHQAFATARAEYRDAKREVRDHKLSKRAAFAASLREEP